MKQFPFTIVHGLGPAKKTNCREENMIKVLAYYLPQYHETAENNEWWGEGFTEWTSVKESKPLYCGHYQPTVPLNGNYYDLTDINSLKWQAELANKYSVYGFCIHHYWFKGKQLLQKPAELLLENRDIDIHYCFSWANESWTRTWNRGNGNSWNVKRDSDTPKTGDGMLMLQEYGSWDDWEKHFNYLLPFFKDERYIKEENKPMFLIYHPEKIQCLHSMLKCWDKLAKSNGFSGIYVVATNNLKLQDENLAANVIFEPVYYFNNGSKFFNEMMFDLVSYRRKRKLTSILPMSYSRCWKNILNRSYESIRKTYYGCMVSFDKTPREGKNATIYFGANPRKFEKYFRKLVKMSNDHENEFVFINAWNEWGEGCTLEPNEKYKYGYLSAVSNALKGC